MSTVSPIKMIIDTDPGVDDAMAILYAAIAPDIELLGLTSIFGNVSTQMATRNALRLAQLAGLDIPVAQGALKPLIDPPIEPGYYVHGDEGFGDIPASTPKGKAIDETAAQFLCRMAREHKGELVICPIGPITNIADAIQLDPEFATNVKKIVFMGGAALVKGNVSAFAEANTYNDAHALNIVLNSGADITMVGLDVTMQALCDADFFTRLAQSSPKLGGFIQDASHFYLKFYHGKGESGCGFHDPAAVIACTDPHLFEIKQLPISVIESGEEKGRTKVVKNSAAPMIGVCVNGDLDAVKQKYCATFANHS